MNYLPSLSSVSKGGRVFFHVATLGFSFVEENPQVRHKEIKKKKSKEYRDSKLEEEQRGRKISYRD